MPANMDHDRAPQGKTVLHNGVHIQSVRHSNTSDVSTGSMLCFLGPSGGLERANVQPDGRELRHFAKTAMKSGAPPTRTRVQPHVPASIGFDGRIQ